VAYPVTLIMIGWGYQPERIQAGIYFIGYLFLFGLVLVLLVSYLVWFGGILLFYCNFKVAPLFLFLISAPFLVKLPIYFLHYWLPKAHVESPTLGSMVLASLILKMGGYGLVVFFLKLGGGVNRVVIFVLVWGGLFCGIVTILQIDIKSFIAYLSIIHITSLRLILMSGGRGKVIISGMSIMLIHGMGAPALFFFFW